uniref:choice-of-anchor D domain-containing protein n=1 Tax=Corallococcus coralloides TaxID=184914 RepID=UPI000FFEC26C|nr:choice-of-anchor D domain-containing protein [Corallococcus coralloides]
MDAGSPDAGPVAQDFPLYLEAGSIDFGTQDACTPGQDQVVLRNPSTKTRKITNVSISGGFTFLGLYDANNVRCELPCTVPSLPLDSQHRIDVRVRFAPGQPGNFQGKVTLYTDDPDARMLTATLGGTGTGSLLVLGQSSLAFDPQPLGTPATRQLLVINLGNLPYSQRPTATQPFSVPATNLDVPAGGSALLDVTFTPTARGSVNGALMLTSQSVCPTPPVASLSGEGVVPATLKLSSTTLAFPATPVNTDSVTKEITVTNAGDSQLDVTQMTLTPNTSFKVSPSGAFSLAAGETQRLSLTFHPVATGNALAALTFTTNASSPPSLALSGSTTQVAPAKLTLSNTVMSFPATPVSTDSAPQEVTLTNTGGSQLNVTGLTLSANSPFRVDNLGPFSIAPGKSQLLKVTFRPLVAGNASDTLIFSSNDAAAPALDLAGSTAVGTACLDISPRSFEFAEQAAGDEASEQKRVIVTNTGTVPLTLTPTVTGSTAFSVTPKTAFTLAPNSAGRELFITFDPDANEKGLVDGLLDFGTSPATDCFTDAALRGTARKTSLTVSPATLPFGDMVVGALPLPERQVTLHNPSAWPVTVYPVPPEALTPYTLKGITAPGLTIAPGDTQFLTVTFAATTWGESFPSTLQLQTDATIPVASVAITGRALAPELKLDRDTEVFPKVASGGEHLLDVTLNNAGNQALFLSRITPDSDEHFQIVDFLPQTVQPKGFTTIKVRFRPAKVGDLETRVRFFTTNDRELPPTLVVKGSSAGPIAIFGVSAIDFGPSQVDQDHVDSTLTLRNDLEASEALKVLSIQVLPPGSAFSVAPITSAEPELGRGSERPHPFSVTFRPTIVGKQHQDTLEIVYEGVTSGVTTTRAFPLKGRGADAQLTAPTDTIDFGATLPRTTSSRSLTITNSGQVPVDVLSVLTNPDSLFRASVDQWSDTIIPAGGTRRIDLTFSPTATGSFSSKLELRLKKSPNTITISRQLTGVGAFAKLELSNNQLFFGEVPRLTSFTRSVTLRNTGSAQLTVSNVQTSSPFSAKLSTGQFPITLAKDATAQLDVTFRPETSLEANATLRVLSNSDQTEDQPLYVSGRGTVPLLVLPGGTNPRFAPQAVGIEGSRQPLVIKNDGKAPLVVYSVKVPGDFCLRPDDNTQTTGCPTSIPGFTVASGDSHSFLVSARPSALGTITSVLTIESNAETTPNTVDLTVEGVGSVSLPTSAINFGPVNFGSFADQTVTVTNTGITSAQVSVDFASGSSEFSAQNLPLVVPAGGSAPLTLRFRPQGSTGGLRSVKAILRVGGTGSQEPLELTLQATATLAELAVARRDGEPFDGSLDFGGTRVNTTSDFIGLRLTHVMAGGSADAGTDAGSGTEVGMLTVHDVALDGADAQSFILQKPTLPQKLVPGGSMDLSLQFRPDGQRRFNAVLRITSDDSHASTLLVTLGGRGRTNQLSLSTPTLEFGARVAESSTSAIRSVRLTNESLQPLVVQGLEIIGATENSEPSHFSLDSAPALPLTLAAQESKEVFVKFVPRPDVTSKANLLVVTSDLESPEAQVSLSGRGLSTVFRALNRTLDFGTVRQSEPATAKVVLTNDSTQELLLMQPKVEGPQATSFVVVSPILGAEGRALPQGDSLTLDLKYDTTVIGTSKATLVLGTKDQERAALVSLSGVSVASFLTIEPLELDLGWVDIGATSAPRTVTLTNQSASPARLSVVENTNPAFEIDASALDAELAPGAQTTVGVTFRGEVGGPAEGTLKLRLRGETTAEASLTLKGNARTLGGTGGGCACGTSGDGGAALALLLLLGLGLARQRALSR